MQFRTVSSLEGERLDALIVPVFKEGDAASNAPADIRSTAEWVARENSEHKLFSPITHLQQADAGSTRLVVVGAGKRDEFDIQRAWQVVSAGVRALWQSTAHRVGVVLEAQSLDVQEAVQSAVEGTIYGEGYDLGLVGKGITFDSGGISIKPAEDMHLMKYDMSGAAAVIATAGVVARMGLPLNLIAVAPCTENLPGGHATKPGDVVTSMSGKTVEVINTDAEGRLVLIDGVTYAQRQGATRVVDVATLTGAVRVALGRHYTGLFGRPEGFVDAVRQAGARSGERLWPMPLADEYRDDMKSDVADLKNSGGRLGGAILGAAFIDAAVEPETEWAHLDIASTAWFEEDRPFSPKGPQGPAIRTLVELAATIAGRAQQKR